MQIQQQARVSHFGHGGAIWFGAKEPEFSEFAAAFT
jgi:hypothetical protein